MIKWKLCIFNLHYQIHVVIVPPRHNHIFQATSLVVNSILSEIGRVFAVGILLEILHYALILDYSSHIRSNAFWGRINLLPCDEYWRRRKHIQERMCHLIWEIYISDHRLNGEKYTQCTHQQRPIEATLRISGEGALFLDLEKLVCQVIRVQLCTLKLNVSIILYEWSFKFNLLVQQCGMNN